MRNMTASSPVDTVSPTRPWRTGGRAALWLLASACLAWAVVRVFGLESGVPAVQLISFTPYAAGCALAVLAAALAGRRWAAAGVAAIAVVALAWSVLPRWTTDTTPADGPRLRVLSANLLAGDADAGAVVDLVRRHRVDLLAVQEFTAGAERTFAAAGLVDVLPHHASYPEPGTTGSALYSRYPLRDVGLRVHTSGFTQAKATIAVPGARPVEAESVHPCAPAGVLGTRHWTQDLARQPTATGSGAVRVLIGDFNATLDHAGLRRLLASGYRDAADVRGAGATATWPFDEKWWVPGVAIDHVLADRRVGVSDYGVHPIPGSDHRAVFAELVLPSG